MPRACPPAPLSCLQTLYGIVATQLGDVTDEFIDVGDGKIMSIADYIRETFAYRYEFRGWMVLVLVGVIMAFRCGAHFGLAKLKYISR